MAVRLGFIGPVLDKLLIIRASHIRNRTSRPTGRDHAQWSQGVWVQFTRQRQQFRVVTGRHFQCLEKREPLLQFRQLRTLAPGKVGAEQQRSAFGTPVAAISRPRSYGIELAYTY